jgi:hypothetical protein
MSKIIFMKYFLLTLILLPLTIRATTFNDKTNSPWKQKTSRGPDAEVDGWYINLGITGARAKLISSNLKCLVIMHVFKDTPAHGKLKKGDIVIGVNGKPFKTAHKNGYGISKFGGEGPLMDFGNALEESQTKDKKGLLTLDVVRKKETLKIILNIGSKYGAFSDSYPNNCKKTNLILPELYAYLAKHQGSKGNFRAGASGNFFATLALLSSGEKKYLPHVEKALRLYAKQTTADATNREGLVCWKYTFAGIALSEYYLATGEKWVLPELKEIRDWLMKTQFTDKKKQMYSKRTETKNKVLVARFLGGWGHNPGFEGYGPIAMVTAQAATALALMKRCGLKIDRKRHDMAYDFLERSTGPNGYVWYNAGDRPHTSKSWADMGRTGCTAIANNLASYKGNKYNKRRDLIVNDMLSVNVKSFPDTHGSPVLGMGWQAMATGINAEGLKKLMTYHKWYFNLAHNPDGSFYYQPNRDNAGYDSNARKKMTATVAFILSLKNKNLHISGASASNKIK